MGLIFAAAAIALVASTCKFIMVLGRRLDANLATAGGSPVDADRAARIGRLDRPRGFSERELQRRTRELIDEIELFLAGQDC